MKSLEVTIALLSKHADILDSAAAVYENAEDGCVVDKKKISKLKKIAHQMTDALSRTVDDLTDLQWEIKSCPR